jgi:multidrug efflux system outer membrane protein
MRRRGIVLSAMALAGCMSMDPAYQRPAAPVPASWPAGDPYPVEAPALPDFTHRDVFRDPRLQTVIARALGNNRDLRIAAANIAAARAQVRITRGAQLPQVGSAASVDANPRRNATTGETTGVQFSPAISVLPSFEVDLFDRLASLTRAQQERLFATGAAARATRVALIGDIADAWLSYAADSSLLAIAENTVRAAERSRVLTEARLRGGIAPRTDLLQAQQVLETARADLAQQRALRAQDANLLQLLVGGPIDRSLLPASLDQVAPTVAALPAGLNSRILLRRPDVIQAEYELRAANAEIGAARAALFPTISLTALLGFASDTLTGLFSSGSFHWSGGIGADYSIFSGGSRRATVDLRRAEQQGTLAAYERSIQIAFREVADALADKGTLADRVAANQRNFAAANDTLRLVTARYREGLDPFLNVLDAQRSAYAAERNLVAVRLAQTRNGVTLYRALGGDGVT